MIKIRKSTKSITIPYANGEGCKLVNATKNLKRRYLNNPFVYDNGSAKFTFSEVLYGDDKIKDSIQVQAQKNKCCYCEKNIRDNSTVEHFRPKKGYKQEKGAKEGKPGYYWLAYSWNNLLYACNNCNKAKGTYFPLFNPRGRVKNHLKYQNCSREQPKIINPSTEDPARYFSFVGAELSVKNLRNSSKKERAITTRDLIKLNRTGLFEDRLDIYKDIDTYRKALFKSKSTPSQISTAKAKFKAYLKSKISKASPFSLMVRSNFLKYAE